ncbi:MAG: EAL and HDOD domain-containing protein [Sandaracinaceae bacterium]
MTASVLPRPSAPQAWVGRQPIFDRDLRVCAFELLYRDGPENRAVVSDPDRASSRTLLSAFFEHGIERLCGSFPAYVNLTRELLLSELVEALPRKRVMLEVLEAAGDDAEVRERLTDLRGRGYRIVLDDYRLDGPTAELLDLAHVVKLDVQALPPDAFEHHARIVQRAGAAMLAEKVETQEELARCQHLGFHAFQGYYLSLPEVRSTHRSPGSRVALLRLMSKVHDPAVPLAELEAELSADVSLSYRIVRFLNSALFARVHRIDSVQHAIVMLGRDALRRWVTLISLAGLDPRPSPLLTTALVRARMCEGLVQRLGHAHPASGFSVGLFSLRDELLGMPMEDVLAELPLSDELNDALAHRAGHLGRVLESALRYQSGDWLGIDLLGLDAAAFPEAYFQAVEWAETHLRQAL